MLEIILHCNIEVSPFIGIVLFITWAFVLGIALVALLLLLALRLWGFWFIEVY